MTKQCKVLLILGSLLIIGMATIIGACAWRMIVPEMRYDLYLATGNIKEAIRLLGNPYLNSRDQFSIAKSGIGSHGIEFYDEVKECLDHPKNSLQQYNCEMAMEYVTLNAPTYMMLRRKNDGVVFLANGYGLEKASLSRPYEDGEWQGFPYDEFHAEPLADFEPLQADEVRAITDTSSDPPGWDIDVQQGIIMIRHLTDNSVYQWLGTSAYIVEDGEIIYGMRTKQRRDTPSEE